MSSTLVRSLGLAVSAVYAAFIVWMYAAQPRTMAEVRGGVASTIGAYAIDRAVFDEGLRHFRADRFAGGARGFRARRPGAARSDDTVLRRLQLHAAGLGTLLSR